jgi:hypothetical protein
MRIVLNTLAICVLAAMLVAPSAARTGAKLPLRALRGNEYLLSEYPTVALASRDQRKAATRLLAEIRAAAAHWPTLKKAAAAGFDTDTARRSPGDFTVHFLHAENHRYSHDSHYLDPRRPEALIYANVPGRRLVLVGLMFAMPRGVKGPTPGGPITRWHTHTVCAAGKKRGLTTPGRNGSCPPGTQAREGSEMLHIWLTGDLRSAFAIHGPLRQLGLAHLIPTLYCHISNS